MKTLLQDYLKGVWEQIRAVETLCGDHALALPDLDKVHYEILKALHESLTKHLDLIAKPPYWPAHRMLHHNFETHYEAWREAIENMGCMPGIHSDRAKYWAHELEAFDAAYINGKPAGEWEKYLATAEISEPLRTQIYNRLKGQRFTNEDCLAEIQKAWTLSQWADQEAKEKNDGSEYDCKGGCGRRTCNLTGVCLDCQARTKEELLSDDRVKDAVIVGIAYMDGLSPEMKQRLIDRAKSIKRSEATGAYEVKPIPGPLNPSECVEAVMNLMSYFLGPIESPEELCTPMKLAEGIRKTLDKDRIPFLEARANLAGKPLRDPSRENPEAFEAWIKQLQKLTGGLVQDFCWRDAFNQGWTPEESLNKLVEHTHMHIPKPEERNDVKALMEAKVSCAIGTNPAIYLIRGELSTKAAFVAEYPNMSGWPDSATEEQESVSNGQS